MDLNEYLKMKCITKTQAAKDLGLNYYTFIRICNSQSLPGLSVAVAIWHYTAGNVDFCHWTCQLAKLGKLQECMNRIKLNALDEQGQELKKQTCQDSQKNYKSVCY